MDQQHFDRLAAAVGAATGRRRALAGLAVGTVAVLGQGADVSAKKRKKKRCTGCPERACCSCRSVKDGPATTCFLIEGLGQADAQTRCIAACGPDLLFAVNTPIAGFTNVCAADFRCGVKSCPVPLKA